MSVWLCIPSKRTPEEANPVLDKWRAQGYKIALWRDMGEANVECNLFLGLPGPYPGYSIAVNNLCHAVLATDPECDWIVSGGDDVLPDPNHTADEIARQCSDYFGAHHIQRLDTNPDHTRIAEGSLETWNSMSTFGVMQPTGDRWGDDPMGRAQWPDAPAYIDRVCGSPWLGREFCRRMYGGRGPLFDGYYHMFEDEELQNVAKKLGVLWQRRDLIHYHQHWGRDGDQTAMPEFLKQVNGPDHWKEAQELFASRKAAGFPGHEPIL